MDESLWYWFKTWFTGKPHFVIGTKDKPYMLRWRLIPRNRFVNIYLHKFVNSDDPRALHDHPWWFISIMLWGRYSELTQQGLHERSAPSIVFRKASHLHRVILDDDVNGNPVPCWTLFITGHKEREWGFLCQNVGWIPWYKFAENGPNGSKISKGCDQ